MYLLRIVTFYKIVLKSKKNIENLSRYCNLYNGNFIVVCKAALRAFGSNKQVIQKCL